MHVSGLWVACVTTAIVCTSLHGILVNTARTPDGVRPFDASVVVLLVESTKFLVSFALVPVASALRQRAKRDSDPDLSENIDEQFGMDAMSVDLP